MKVTILYDSVFGNTEKVAKEMGNALAAVYEVSIHRVGDIQPDQLSGMDFLFTGSPTRGFRPTPVMTKFLDNLPKDALKDVRFAAFDTRIDPKEVNNLILTIFVYFFGYAAEPIAKKLMLKGGIPACPPEGFFVNASEGPLRDGELTRAAKWAGEAVLPLGMQSS